MYSKFNLNIFTASKRSYGKVMFLDLSVILFTGGCMHGKGGMHGMGMHGKEGACIARGLRDVWWGRHAQQGACMQGACMAGGRVWQGHACRRDSH